MAEQVGPGRRGMAADARVTRGPPPPPLMRRPLQLRRPLQESSPSSGQPGQGRARQTEPVAAAALVRSSASGGRGINGPKA